MSRTNKLISEIIEKGYTIEISPFCGDYVVAIHNEKLDKGTHYHCLDFFDESLPIQIENCLASALHYVNENE